MPPRSERAENLRRYVEGETARIKAEGVGTVPTYGELAIKFGYATPKSAYEAIRKVGLHNAVNEARGEPILNPSREAAWMLGVLAAGGYSNPSYDRLLLESNNRQFSEAFLHVGERLFGVNARIRTPKHKGKEFNRVIFRGQRFTEMLGDLRRPNWPTTIIERHGWILQSEQYTWGFLEGVFERIGNVYTSRKNRVMSITFWTNYSIIANFLANLLVRVGVERLSTLKDAQNREDIEGIAIYGMLDMKRIADNIHSRIPEKEEKLELCRRLVRRKAGKKTRTPSEDSTVESPEQLNKRFIDDYERAREICLIEYGRLPTIGDLDRLREQGMISSAASSLAKHFGNGNMTEARKHLERLIRNRREAGTKQENRSTGQEVQIYP